MTWRSCCGNFRWTLSLHELENLWLKPMGLLVDVGSWKLPPQMPNKTHTQIFLKSPAWDAASTAKVSFNQPHDFPGILWSSCGFNIAFSNLDPAFTSSWSWKKGWTRIVVTLAYLCNLQAIYCLLGCNIKINIFWCEVCVLFILQTWRLIRFFLQKNVFHKHCNTNLQTVND